MDNEKTTNYFINKVIEHLSAIRDYMFNIDYETFRENKMLQSAVCFEFIQVYENAKHIKLENDEEFNDVLIVLRGFRNIIVHEYGEVDFTIVYKTATEDVPKFIEEMLKHN